MKTPLNENATSGANHTYWIDSTGKPLEFKPLNQNLETDVVVIGGGIAGVSTAYCLLKSGKKVVLVEDGFIASGETGRTSAHLASAVDDGFTELERMFGEEGTKLFIESHQSAIDFIEKTVLMEQIDCDFKRVNGYLFLHPNDSKTKLDDEMKAAQKAGLIVRKLDHVPGLKTDEGECLEFGQQAQFHPLKYIKALCEIIIAKGGKIFTQTHAEDISHMGIVTDKGFNVRAQHVVVATNTPVNNKFTMHLKQYPYRTYVIASTIEKGNLPPALWWDSGDYNVNDVLPPYHYVRTENYDDDYDLLITGGEDHPTALADFEKVPEEERFLILEEWTRKHFDIDKVIYTWSGQIMEPMDSIGFIGRNPHDKSNVYIITGDSGNGLTHATVGGMLITDMINGKKNKWEDLYDPSRFKLFKAGRTFLKENIGNISQYIQTRPGRTEPSQINNLGNDEAVVVKMDGNHFGVYKDPQGNLHKVSAVCTHLKCIVKWNSAEKSWDCPCHGSRFTCEGKVINGPANFPLDYELMQQPGEPMA